ncbi:hypothetical protein RHGRI_002899 [Rhododendron griersonianum]|uniref:Uncharacterized protein n=1 Tax=Rhododendron griersonianum TaxID=479676 RepID=A0AAV6LTG9_9ERIC|nr:hypothetical protein RHGRI_002899 [Rhododendron griersonianum]
MLEVIDVLVYTAEISFPPRKRTWNRVSVSISPSKGAERLGRTEFHLLKRHSLQVACSQKKEVHVVEARFLALFFYEVVEYEEVD